MMMTTSIKRVVSCFFWTGSNATRESLHIAVFHRCDTMPTFASHWAACSGSIEMDESPPETARREIQEETNISVDILPEMQYGLYVDVPFRKTAQRETIIRVYPFTVQLPSDWNLELRGTEHDSWKFVSVAELEALEPAVPGLARAFHHATNGKYLENVSEQVRQWANDHTSGAAAMTRNALELVQNHGADPKSLRLLRPSMVAIPNAMNRVIAGERVEYVLESLMVETKRAVEYAVQEIQPLLQGRTAENPLIVATFSRSSTIVGILQRLLQDDFNNLQVVCSKSTPGDEGVLMAQDLGGVDCVDDSSLLERVRSNEIDLILVGSDCITETSVVNKVGTRQLATEAASTRSKVYCCTDRWKRWDDIFPPPLEGIFEPIPKELFDAIIMPPPLGDECEVTNKL